MKNLLVSRGQASGCSFSNRLMKLSRRLPFENATFANLDDVARFAADIGPSAQNIICSMMRLLAPMRFTGWAALSVDTLKYDGGTPISRIHRQHWSGFSRFVSNICNT